MPMRSGLTCDHARRLVNGARFELKFRRKKKPQSDAMRHPTYRQRTGARGADDLEAEKRGARRSFTHIIIVCVVVLVVLIVAATSAFLTSQQQPTGSISASDTYAVSSTEQSAMRSIAQRFATGMMLFSYSDDEDAAFEGKNAALACMATNTSSYSAVRDMTYGGGAMDGANLRITLSDVSMESGSQSYAGYYTYSLDAAPVDTSLVDDDNPDGTIVDAGYHFELQFGQATNSNTGENEWVIVSARIARN